VKNFIGQAIEPGTIVAYRTSNSMGFGMVLRLGAPSTIKLLHNQPGAASAGYEELYSLLDAIVIRPPDYTEEMLKASQEFFGLETDTLRAEDIVGTGPLPDKIAVGTIEARGLIGHAHSIEQTADAEQHATPTPTETIPPGKVVVRETRVVNANSDGSLNLDSEGHTVLDAPTE
jgi:hypothetical protein